MNSKVFTHVDMFLMLKVTFGPNFKTFKFFMEPLVQSQD
jgi:hypothetical protein